MLSNVHDFERGIVLSEQAREITQRLGDQTAEVRILVESDDGL
jgi:hypothetical protein